MMAKLTKLFTQFLSDSKMYIPYYSDMFVTNIVLVSYYVHMNILFIVLSTYECVNIQVIKTFTTLVLAFSDIIIVSNFLSFNVLIFC